MLNDQCNNSKKRARFNINEDNILISLVNQFGEGNWDIISEKMDGRNVRQVKERWMNFLSPKISKNPWSKEEDDLLIKKIDELGTKWVILTQFFPNRSDTSIKNRWLILKKIIKGREKKKLLSKNSLIINTFEYLTPENNDISINSEFVNEDEEIWRFTDLDSTFDISWI